MRMSLRCLFLFLFLIGVIAHNSHVIAQEEEISETEFSESESYEPKSSGQAPETIEPAETKKEQVTKKEQIKPEEIKETKKIIEKPKDISAPSQVKEFKEEEEAPSEDSADEETAIKGLDTVSVREPEGNWLLKRIWWEKAQKKYEKIKRVVSKILESRMIFFDKRNDLEKNVLNPFYSEMGLKKGPLMETIQSLLAIMKKEKEVGIAGDKEKEFAENLKAEETKLKQLDIDMQGILDLDDSIDQDLKKLSQEINRSRRYEDNAWQLFKAIAKELSHKKARELYYKMDALWKNVKNIDSYIKGPFSQHFDSIIEDAKIHVERIKDISQTFKDKGIDFQKQYQDLVKHDEMTTERESQESQDSQEKNQKTFDKDRGRNQGELDKKDKKRENGEPLSDQGDQSDQEEAPGFFGSILKTLWNGITWPFRKIWGWISALWN